MERLYVPYRQGKPALVAVNGHNIIVLAAQIETLQDSEYLNPDSIKEFEFSPDNIQNAFSELEGEESAGVVVTPDNISADDLIDSLMEQLPWVQ